MYKSSAKFMFGERFVSKSSPIFYFLPLDTQTGLTELWLLSSMSSIQEWAEYLAEWATKDPNGFHSTLIMVVIPFFIASALISRKLARMIEAYEWKQQILQEKKYPSSKKA